MKKFLSIAAALAMITVTAISVSAAEVNLRQKKMQALLSLTSINLTRHTQ